MITHISEVTGDHYYTLVLNSMIANTENCIDVGSFNTIEEAKEYYQEQLAGESYRQQGHNSFNFDNGAPTKSYYKVFKVGSPLEWCNPLEEEDWDTPNSFGHGLHSFTRSLD